MQNFKKKKRKIICTNLKNSRLSRLRCYAHDCLVRNFIRKVMYKFVYPVKM